jgi:hypothetical protein
VIDVPTSCVADTRLIAGHPKPSSLTGTPTTLANCITHSHLSKGQAMTEISTSVFSSGVCRVER